MKSLTSLGRAHHKNWAIIKKNELEKLIETYQERLAKVKADLVEFHGQMKCQKLEAKRACYRQILKELEQLKVSTKEGSTCRKTC